MSDEKYNKLIESIELDDIELYSLECWKNKNFPPKKRTSIQIGLKSNKKETYLEQTDLNVQFGFEITAFSDEVDDPKNREDIPNKEILFNIKFILELNYILDLDNVDDILIDYKDEIDRFVENNVPVNAWPYAREIISSVTTRMGFPSLVIPTYKHIGFF